ncbi:uncharacterized protein NECHADRAFT_89397 [Fusarium vanettenii 77-13-4]|uniref:Transcription factor domain-containing protein n=1 Tax=Fusarium vanettenii (strain ATCC MYA-4622 / CBS 123669 / FGSC 9596 / NRRL 45880 / 77-13-4) TaxID=660122 RepID=C7ZR34_FUSV7|nr:uncharacterized protein NECHADRAFT_89397 [Fusarium vanettenii 77-13-4]EEU33521.1 hypothetical protein NECHADRAFT_89397 [Fusarium vanettenii 77-13-4]
MCDTEYQFINTGSVNPVSRRLIRSHVMRGKNVGKKRLPRRQQQVAPISRSKITQTQSNIAFPPIHYSQSSMHELNTGELFSPRVLFNIGDELGRITSPYHVSDQDRKDISSFLLRFSEMVYPPQFSLGSRASKAIFIEYLFVDDAYFHSFLAMSAACFNCITNGESTTRAEMHHHCSALRLLNAKLAGQDALSEISIASVISMCLHSYLRQDVKKMMVHLKGLIKIIDLRGGIGSLVACPALMDKVRRIDVDVAMQIGIPLQLEFTPMFSEPTIAPLFLSDFDLPGPFRRTLQETNKQLYFIARDIARLAHFMSATATTPDLRPGFLQETVMSLFYRLLGVDTVAGQYMVDPVARGTHIVLASFMTLALLRFDHQRRKQYCFVSRQCASRLNCSSFVEAMVDHVEAHFWMLMASGSTILEDDDHGWLIPQLKETVGKLGISVWSQAMTILKRYPWISGLQDEPAHPLWMMCLEQSASLGQR